MSLTSKSPRKVALAALAVGKEALSDYSHRYSPKTYTQPQLFACLVLKAYMRLDYRGIEGFIADLPEVRQWIGLKRTPDHSTFQKAARRLFGAKLSERLLDAAVRQCMKRRKRVKLAAVDSSGLESGHRSAYFVRRRQRGQKKAENALYQTTTYTRFPKLALVCDCASHVILAAVPGTGPSPDHPHFAKALDQTGRRIGFDVILADAGYDSESNHVYARHEHGVRTIIPPKIGRPTTKPPSAYYRRLMARYWSRLKKRYGQRWQDETVFSMIKRNLGCELGAMSHWARVREMMLLVLTHNVTILLLFLGFSTEHHWQDYRTRKDRSLKTVSDAGFIYPKSGKYLACVKVVDTFGCDTSITVEVKV
jgi:hypothetical protein